MQDFVVNSPLFAYLVLFGGMFIEGETFFLAAAIFALEGYMSWWWVLAVSFAGVIIGDVAWYYLGRLTKDTKWGMRLAEKYKNYQGWVSENFTNRYFRLAFVSKFLYYVNRLTPLLAGWEKLDFKRFFKIHLIAGFGWLLTMFVAGKFFGLIINAIGVKVVVGRLYWVFAIIAVLVVVGEYCLRRFFIKKIKK